MTSFPVLNSKQIIECFNKICNLYISDKVKLLDAFEKATVTDAAPFKVAPRDIDSQISVIKSRLLRTADGDGQRLLVRWIEELYVQLKGPGAIGVIDTAFLSSTEIVLQDESIIKYLPNERWVWVWQLEVDGNSRLLELDIRDKSLSQTVIVQEYVLQYVQQAIIAYKNYRPAAALSLMTIALEGTLRDALEVKGFTYNPSDPSQDVYEILDMYIHKHPGGYKITFPKSMPLDHGDYLSSAGNPTYKEVKIKRFIKDGETFLEIRQVDDIVDYWSSDKVVKTGVKKISGLGTAIHVGRNIAKIITPVDLPPDLDGVIQAVRNNLIHLSGKAMSKDVLKDKSGRKVTLGDFLKDKNRVFDTIFAIGDTVNAIYDKIAKNTL